MNENVSTLESRSKSKNPVGVAPAPPGAWEKCVVCGHSVEPGREAAQINHLGNTVNLCGPQCRRTFASDPAPYLGRLARVMRERAWNTEPEAA